MSNIFSPELVIFDCDGTLVNSELLYNKIISDILLEAGLTDYNVQTCLQLFTGLTLSHIREKVERAHNLDLSSVLTSELYISRAQAEMDKNIEAVANASDLLMLCTGISKICIGSNGERSSVIKSLQLTGLYDFFGGNDDCIFTKIQVKNAKPAPDLFEYAAAQMG
ncbi:MAG: HAD family hydrolase, partial [Alphaproteobacteria bacterium]